MNRRDLPKWDLRCTRSVKDKTTGEERGCGNRTRKGAYECRKHTGRSELYVQRHLIFLLTGSHEVASRVASDKGAVEYLAATVAGWMLGAQGDDTDLLLAKIEVARDLLYMLR